MVSERAIAYSEVYAILKMMNPQYLDKIPDKLQKAIIEEMDKNYQPKIVPDMPLKEQKLKQKTYTILAMLNFNYWCETHEHKEELLKIYSNNEKIKDAKIREQYNPDNIFKSRTNNTINNTNDTVALVKYKESVFKRLLDKIKSIFAKK